MGHSILLDAPSNVGAPPVKRHQVLERVRQSDYGQERLCSGCHEYWPDDSEFFFKGRSICKACYYETPSAQKKLKRS